MGTRSVSRIITGVRTFEGAGFAVRRPFPTPELDYLDPFLLLDEMGPSDVRPGEAKGAPDHPHRGFETVTYLLSGEMEHRDSAGHAGRLGPGDVQWMTAGAGVIHSEMPSAEFQSSGGRMHGFQLWVNLPRKDKLVKPRYQEIDGNRVPVAQSPDGRTTVRVIAGESLGARAEIQTRIPILYLHVAIRPGGRMTQKVRADLNAIAYVFSGEGDVGVPHRRISDGQAAIFSNEGDTVSIEVPSEARAPMEFLLLAGKPLREPVSRYGPFVMNTQSQIRQAIEDYRSGHFGHIA
ncbi:MAG: pirin family protein [Nitrospirae bacterium]|nr:pirin family protein [Nitrospirota bacterium]